MDWGTLGSIGEFVGGFAVVVSLIYVGFQIRQSSNATRAASQIAIKQLSTQITNQLVAPEMARIYLQGLKDSASLSPEDRVRFHSLVLSLFGAYEAGYFQSYFGTIAEEIHEPMSTQANFHLRQPGVERWWNAGGSNRFSRQFVEYLEKKRAEQGTEAE